MKYIFSFIFFSGLFFIPPSSAADSSVPLGIVRVLNMNPPSYDSKTGKSIPDSQNIVFPIRDIQIDKKSNDRVWLLAEDGGQYGALLVRFDPEIYDSSLPQKFNALLKSTPDFQINLNREDLLYKNSGLDTYAEVSAKNVWIYSEKQKLFVSLKSSLCPMTQEKDYWWRLGKLQSVREDCL